VRSDPQYAAGPLRHAHIKLAERLHNYNPSTTLPLVKGSTNLHITPFEAEKEANLWRVRVFRQQNKAQEYVRNSKAYDKVPKFHVGQLVLRRLRQRGGYLRTTRIPGEPTAPGGLGRLKEADRQYNLSSIVYRIAAIRATFPLPSYVLQVVGSNIISPGTVTAPDLELAPPLE
jgi:hypothetical protein